MSICICICRLGSRPGWGVVTRPNLWLHWCVCGLIALFIVNPPLLDWMKPSPHSLNFNPSISFSSSSLYFSFPFSGTPLLSLKERSSFIIYFLWINYSHFLNLIFLTPIFFSFLNLQSLTRESEGGDKEIFSFSR